MTRAVQQKGGLYAYLKSRNLIGADEAILAVAKQTYWAVYRRNWRKVQRSKTRQFTVPFTANEYTVVSTAAKAHKRSITRFIRESCIGYIERKYLVPDVRALGTIRYLLAANYASLQQMVERNAVSPENGRMLLFQMAELEHKVLSELNSPKDAVDDTP